MRIGIEAQRIFRKKKHGMDIYAVELIKELQRQDQENEYFIFVKPGPDICIQETDNFTVVLIPGLTYADWEQINLPKAAKSFGIDVLHCTSNTAPLFTDIPVVLTLHDIIYLNKSFGGGSLYQRLGHHYRKWVVPQVYKKAKAVFTVSDFERATITAKLGGAQKLRTVYNGVCRKFKKPKTNEIVETKDRLNLPDDYIFFLGNTAPKKNMKGMLEAYRIYCDGNSNPLPLVIAESNEVEVGQMLSQIFAPELMKHIILTGYVPHNELPAIYAGARLFVYPSLRESFGIPIIEAMACGTPVITSDTSSMPEVAGGAAHLIDPTKPMDIAVAIEFVLQEEYYQDLMIKNGLSKAKEFTWANTARRVRMTYYAQQKVAVTA